jgi:hypothetical protein
MAGAGDTAPELVGEDDARLVHEVRRPQRPTLEDRSPDETDARRKDVAGLELLQPLARDGHARQRGVGLKHPQHGRAGTEQRQHALADPFRDLREVERFRQCAGGPGQLPGAALELRAVLVGVLASGDVTDERHEAADDTVVAHVRNVGRLDVPRLAVTIEQRVLEGDETAAQRRPHVGGDGRVGRLPEDLVDGSPVDLVSRASEPLFVGVVIEPVALLGVDIGDERWHRVDDELKPREL